MRNRAIRHGFLDSDFVSPLARSRNAGRAPAS